MVDTHTVFIFQAYEGTTPQLTLMDLATVEVYADNIEEAEKKVRKLVKKKEYRVTKIIQVKNCGCEN